jgi:hypothetical protein
LLRLTAVISLLWAVVLLVPPIAATLGQLSPLEHALANELGITNLVFACLFWYAARQPSANHGVVYAAIMLLVLKTANDVYELLVLLPGSQALVGLTDLVVSLALLVGILEALPRLLKGQGDGQRPA